MDKIQTTKHGIPYPPETNSSHLEMDGWDTIVSFWHPAYIQVRTVGCRECKYFQTHRIHGTGIFSYMNG